VLKTIKIYLVGGIILALSSAVVWLYLTRQGENVLTQTVDAPAVVQQIQQLHDLVTVKYTIQKVIGLKEQKVPFGTESVLLMVQANALGGVNLSEITPQHVTISSNGVVNIRLPAPRILHVFINDKETRVWDRTKTWWTVWDKPAPELEQRARIAAIEAVTAAALEMGILAEAERNAQQTIAAFLAATGSKSVTFQTTPPAAVATNAPAR
jgi:hypothetical protein